MKKSFFIFILVLLLMITLILLRIQSISFPKEGGDETEIIYLEEFQNDDRILKIFSKNDHFYIKPYIHEIQLNGQNINTEMEICHDDIISARTKQFRFEIQPKVRSFKKIFQRPIGEILPLPGNEKYIGGWMSPTQRRILSSERDKQLLKKLIIELEPELLKKIIPARNEFSGRLIHLRRNKTGAGIQVKSEAVNMIRTQNFNSQSIEKNRWLGLKSGDVFTFRKQGAGTALQIKFDFNRVKSRMFKGSRGQERLVSADIIYLIVSYLKKNRTVSPTPLITASLKSLDEGNRYRIQKSKSNLFLGKKGLFLFSLRPDKLLNRQYIPDAVHEGGIMDIKEMLDHKMLYRKQNNFYPVDPAFLDQIREIVILKKFDLNEFLKQHHIEWIDFQDQKEIEHFLVQAETRIRKIKKKGNWNWFCREIKKMNNLYFLKGLGIKVNDDIKYRVFYRKENISWIPAETWFRDIPHVSGIEDYYWGPLIKDSKEVEFRIDFNRPPGRVRLLSVADYRFRQEGRPFTRRNFFDGVQDISLGRNGNRLYVKISNILDFNQSISIASLQLKADIKTSMSNKLSIFTDETWSASIDMTHWMAVRLNPYFSASGDAAADIKSIWYNEDWNPIFRGVKHRYFKKDFRLDSRPLSSSWRIFTFGQYLLWINNQPIVNPEDFTRALRPGPNTLMVMISKKGYMKKFLRSRLFKIKNNQIVLLQKILRRSSFVRGKGSKKPTIFDNQNQVLAYSVKINDKFHRFYSPVASSELQGIVGSSESGSWGIEQVFYNLHKQKGVSEIHLTLNSEWQKIAVRQLFSLLGDIKKRESMNPVYLNLKNRLIQTENHLSRARIELMILKDEHHRAITMRKIIDMQNRIESLKTEINKIKNYFYEASMIIMNSRGQILVSACYPYDEKSMQMLNGSLLKPYRAYEVPELNRAWKWRYNPGSTVKVLDSIAFLHSLSQKHQATGGYAFPHLKHLLDPSSNFSHFPRNDLKGSRMLNGKKVFFQLQNFRGHNIPYGFCSLKDALTHSYNTYFAYLALHHNRMLTLDSALYKKSSYFISKSNIPLEKTYRDYPVLEFAEKLGFNRRIDLLANLNHTEIGRFLNRSPYDAFTSIESVFPVNAYTPSDIAYFSIGQSDLQLTTLQNSLVVSTILNNGCLFYPSVIKSINMYNSVDKKMEMIEPNPEKSMSRIFDPDIAEQIKQAMKNVVDSGTAGGVFSRKLKQARSFYAKTGTAETKFYRDHSLFVGFVIFRNGEKIIFSTVVPRSGTGAAVAGRLTARIIKDIIEFENKNPNRPDNPY
jgi:cell division protein FtsI/penicillin-binding protein 2